MNGNIEKGKWYISKKFKKFTMPPTQKSTYEMIENNIGADKMVIAGPFDTKKDALDNLAKFDRSLEPFVWESK